MFAFTADNHANTRGLRPEIPMGDTLQPLQEIVGYCLRHKCSLVLGGDLYDTNNPPARLVARVNEILAQMKTAGLEVWAIQGNHDKDPETPWSTIAPGVQWFNEQLVTVGGLKLYGLDFCPSSIIAPKISQMPACDVVVIHQALRQGLGFEDAWNCDLDWFDPAKVKNVLAGDLHRAKLPMWSTKKDVMGWYPGTPYMTTLDEDPVPSFIVVHGKDANGYLQIERPVLKHRPFKDITASTEEELLTAIKDLPMDPKPIVVLRCPVDAQSTMITAKKVLKETFLIEIPLPARNAFSTTRNLIVEARQGLTMAKVINEKVKDPQTRALMLDLVGCRDREAVQSVLASHRAALQAVKP